MEVNDEVLSALLQAVEVSPDSAALRRHYAEVLLNRGYTSEAEAQFRRSLDLDPGDAATLLGLARALHTQGQNSNALLLVKQVLRDSSRPAKAYILYARLLLALGSVEAAVREYNRAIDADPKASDPDLADQLGLERRAAAKAAPRPRPVAPPPLRPVVDEAPPAAGLDVVETVRQLFALRPALGFQQIGGFQEIREELKDRVIRPLREPGTMRAYAAGAGARFLLVGPPGSGKRHLGRALAGELLAPFLALSLEDLVELWQGGAALLLREIFREARRRSPAVMLFEQIEHFGAQPALAQQFLSELDSLVAQDGVIVFLSTETPWRALPPLIRPQRFDRVFFVAPPSALERADILRILCQGKPQSFLALDSVAQVTEGFTIADLRSLVEMAVRQKLQQSLHEGRPMPLTTTDLLRAADEISPSVPVWASEAREHIGSVPEGQGGFEDLRRYVAQPVRG